MLQSLRVQRFKCISDVTLQLGRVNVLVGPNNAGKSSLLQALQFGVSVAQSLRLDNVATWNDDRLAGTLSAQQLVYTPLRDVHALASGGTLRQDEAQAIKITYVTDDLGTTEVTVRRGRNKNISVTVDGRQLGERLESIDAPYSVVAPGLAGIPSFEEYRSQGIVRRAAARGDANGVFRNILWTLRQNAEAWSSFCANISHIFPNLLLDVSFEQNIQEHILAVAIRDDGNLPIDSCGTGVLQAVQTLAYIDLYKPKVLVLDEPDSHLHPDNQRRMARLLANLAEHREFQIVASTHSRHLLDELSLTPNISWISGGKVRPENTDRVEMLLELGALDLGDKLRNGATPYVVLTEDTKPAMLKRILASSGLGEDVCEIWSYAGCSNEPVAKVLAQFIRDHAPNTRVVVHRDRDYEDEATLNAYTQRMQEAHLAVLITAGTDVESHFLAVDHLRTIAPEVEDEQLRDFVEQATTATRDTSIERLVNARVKAAHKQRNKTGGDEPNYGAIAAQATIDYDADPLRYRLGKKVLGRVVALIQQHVGHNIQPSQDSPALAVESLRALVP